MASKVFSELPEEEQLPQRKNLKERFFVSLPKNFGRKVYLEAAIKLGIPDKTAQRHIAEFCKMGMLQHNGYDKYQNLVVEKMDILRR